MKNAKPKERKIHVALPDEVHQKLRVMCALEDVTIQEYVSRLIAKDVQDVELPVKAANTKRESRYA
ncbi:MAG: hypothetical protein OZSIB_0347 [Candidatus Ozemobacter sibiricus]|uniref:Toxin-antitoxin system HicB family antitoxin n=1 Tax=Candidatus Ozemobacter sibiricus TaxID=2268124 RepID=A0A367ZM92_9BACT|nr:MAG: hypothetical protein OZSIB_0347 [Candidatus Ozemobacter sibiricus]HRT71661.1 hypothetical protein [Syntrophales bacterium]